ncbi:MAG: ribosome small subunit-dependent GTPase A [bacterium]|nr:ribosome small subunit-dependent GTPase A [bacterium]
MSDLKGLVTKSTGSWYSVKVEDGTTLEARLRGKFKLQDKKITNPVAVGDRVVIEKQESGEDYYIISELIPRENYVIRKSPKKTAHSHILASNVDQAIVIATFKDPKTSLGFIDRFLVTTESYRIPSLIVFNKSDLLTEQDFEPLQEIIDVYEGIGYQCMLISALNGDGLEEFNKMLSDKISLIAGHSGTGKSTIINLVSDKANQETSEISNFANKGVHTTTFAEMFETQNNGYIIDTPGIKELGLIEIEDEELSHFFPEMREYLGTCKFHNCMHTHEPGCKVVEALERGEIPMSRYYNYLSMLENEDNRR